MHSKQQKLHKRKVLWFNGICHNVGKHLQFCFYLYDFSLTAKSISRENFRDSSKSTKTTKVFFRVTFVVYGIYFLHEYACIKIVGSTFVGIHVISFVQSFNGYDNLFLYAFAIFLKINCYSLLSVQ